jgi:DNA-binding transcriptional ArsR family regulator
MQMMKLNKTRLEARARVLKALAHPTRLFLVEALSSTSHCVSDLTEMVGADTSTVSKHLSILKNAGLIQDEKRGQQVFYTLRIPCALNFLDCVETVLREQIKDGMAAIG